MDNTASKRTLLLPLSLVSSIIFLFWSVFGFYLGREVSYRILFSNFGDPQGEQVFFFAITMFFSAAFSALVGILVSAITMHWLGRRFNVPVAKPTLFGFLINLVCLFILIILYNRTH